MGPLDGMKVIEIAGIGPGPFAAMVLADLGANVIRIDRPGKVAPEHRNTPSLDLLNRGRPSIAIDLRVPEGVEAVLRLVEGADVLIEGFRPGVMERLGVGPETCLSRNPRLVYGRMTGWGQEGPLSQAAGHDINYIALAGALHAIGRKGEKPLPPLNLVGDFGGGGMLMVVGVLAALFERTRSGQGQVVDAAMVDGAALLMTMMYGMRAGGFWNDERGSNLLDTGAHFYDAFETRDGKYVAVGSIEPQFYAELLRLTGLDAEDLPPQMARDQWPALHERVAEVFRSKTRDEWCEILEGSDACFAPVLTMGEALEHPHNRHRGTFVEVDGTLQPGPAPRFSRTPGRVESPPAQPGADSGEALQSWGFSEAEVQQLRDAKAIV
jgi:alpha-methylacyl-CoA racemase